MRFADVIRTATTNLRRSKLRSWLSLVGIAIGVFAVTIMLSLGLALRTYVEDQISAFGDDLISIEPSVPGASARGSITAQMSGMQVQSLTLDDVERLRDKKTFPYVTAVTGVRSAQAYVTAGGEEERAMIMGVSADYLQIDGQLRIANGRFLREQDELEAADVAVLGPTVAEKLFGEDDPVGQKVRAGSLSLTVVGVLRPRGATMGLDLDSFIYAPLTTVSKKLAGLNYLNEIDIKVGSAENIPLAVADIERLMRKWHGISDPSKDDFHLHTSTTVMEQASTVTGGITVFLGLLAAISLLVGGIGIMNIMLVSVTERIKEIGLRKALGARGRDVMLQFLAESVILTTFGGLFGGAVGAGATVLAVAAARRFAGIDVPLVVSLPAFLGAALVAAIVGIVFGLYPARKAAKLDPIVALRFE